MLIDTHAHLDFPDFADDLDGVLARAADHGVLEIVTIGIDVASSRRAVALAQDLPRVFATVGIHPHGAQVLGDPTLEELRGLARQHRVVAIGEIGLDYYRDRQPRDVQRQCLGQQLELAVRTELPVVIHVRAAYADFMAIIADYVTELPGVVLHCFAGDWEVAERALDWGFYLSIPGTVTFAKAELQQQVAQRAPLERLLLETDAPFLAPVPYRGKTNEPSFLRYTAQKVADLRRIPLEELARATTENATTVFKLDGWRQQRQDVGNRGGL
jgi:TatD DNase family protein